MGISPSKCLAIVKNLMLSLDGTRTIPNTTPPLSAMPSTATSQAPTSSAPPPGQTVLYNVYHICITQGTSPFHQGIALVPAQLHSQTAGRFYHVTGTIGLGMDYQCRPAEKFGLNPAFKSAVLMFHMPKSLLAEFEAIASSVPPPHDPRVLTERNPEPPARDCGTWVMEVLGGMKTLLADKGMDL